MPSLKVEFPPLLPPGFHTMTLEGLHQLTVEHPRFGLSSTRSQIMKNLWIVAGCLCRWRIHSDLWIDGSFLTEKIDPPDVDFMVVMPDGFLNSVSPEQEAVLNWLCEDTSQPAKAIFQCDSYSLYCTNSADPGYSDFLRQDAYWKKQFGESRRGDPKGMALIHLSRLFA
jgi:hypothetical protein